MVQVITPLIQKFAVLIMPLGMFLLTFIISCLVRGILLSRFAHWARKTRSQLDDIIVEVVKVPSLVWCLMLGVYFALGVSALPAQIVHIAGKLLLTLGIFSATMVLANIASRAIKEYSHRMEAALPVASLTQNITRIVIFGLGILIILNSMGISITPVLATLGVGGLAVALALQDTLSNIFAGFHITVAKQIRIGDYIKLDSGEEGYVADINWRATKIRMLPNNMVLVPNEKLTKAIITNYYLPEKEMAVLVELGVHYHSDLEKVEKAACEVAKEVMNEVSGGVPEFSPFIRYHSFGESDIKFTVILRAKEFVDQYLIKHEFIKRLHKRYNKEGIVIPYPIRAINYSQEKGKIA